MEILVKWLKNPASSKVSIEKLIGEFNKEIETIESSIRDKLNVRDEEQFRDCFQEITRFLGNLNNSIDQANDQLKNFEGDTAVKIRELRDLLTQRNKQLQEAASKMAADGDAVKLRSDFFEEDAGYEVYPDIESNDNPSQLLRSSSPVDEEEVRQVELTKKIAGDCIIRARKLVCSDLFPVIKVGDDASNIIQSNSPTINQSLFSFPICQVSQSIYDLALMLKKMMKDARNRTESEERYCLYQAIRSILELYLISCQINHQKMISEFPKYAAVFHNNCLFIAHQLTILPMYYGLWENDTFIVTFIDLIPAIKESAYDTIIDLMKKHKQIIMDFFEDSSVTEALKAASGEDANSKQSLTPFYKALKKGLTHLNLIKTSLDVLPSSVCNKLIGTLVNCMVAGIISSILNMEDIPAYTATKLEDILNGITKDIDQLMENFSLPYGQILPKWLQFQEIKIILQASLKDIVDRWADGNGPLAAAFTPEEVKSLIRSLFQNTDRRSAALARIR